MESEAITENSAIKATTEPGAEPSKPTTPEGWWNLTRLDGSIPRVLLEIDSRPDVPDHWKAAIKADIEARCAEGFNFVYLDAHYHIEKGNGILHYNATADKKLL